MANTGFKNNTAFTQPINALTLEVYEDLNKKAENAVDGIEILVEMSKKGKIDLESPNLKSEAAKLNHDLGSLANRKRTGRKQGGRSLPNIP